MWNDILQNIARKSARQGTLPEPTAELLCEIWPALVGESLARLSTPVELCDHTLRIAVRNKSLVDDWKSSPMPLLRKIRRFCPWSVETLELEHSFDAGVVDSIEPSSDLDADLLTQDSNPPIEDTTEDAIDDELRSIIDAIDNQRRQRQDD